MMSPLKIISIGAGAIGTYIGGSLALQGHEVGFVERLEAAEMLKERGLKLSLPRGDFQIPKPEIYLSMESAIASNHYDLALFALKSYDAIEFLNKLKDAIPDSGNLPPFLCLSNGVANEELIGRVFGPEKVIAGTVTTAVGRLDAGDIVCERLRGVGVADEHPVSRQLVEAMNEAGLQARLFSNGVDMKWSKLLTNLISNASSAILDMSPAEIFANPELYRMEVRQLNEALMVMRRSGIRVVDLPGTPVRLLAFAVRLLPDWLARPFLAKAVGGGRGGKMPSFHIDLHRGLKLSEVEYLNGAVVMAGEKFGMPTPINQVLTDTLLGLTHGEIPLDDFAHQPDRLLALME